MNKTTEGEKMNEPITIYEGAYLGVYKEANGRIYMGISDGVGYVGSMNEQELKELYDALKPIMELSK